MNRFLIAATLIASTLSLPSQAADVGVSVNIGQPGFYGRLDIGGFPAPALIYPQPVMIQPVPRGRPPLYLHVPPGHAKHWSKHCRAYNACGERVYFVQDTWYSREYVPRHQQMRGEHRDYDHRDRRDAHRYDERRDYRGEEGNRGRGNGRGNGHRHDD